MMAFRIAWFKVHKPLAYYSAYFYRRSQKDSFDAQIMCSGVDELRRTIMAYKKNPNLSAKEDALLATMESVYEFYMRGFSFAPIDLYESDAYKFLPVGEKQLRPPFVAISGLRRRIFSTASSSIWNSCPWRNWALPARRYLRHTLRY